MPFSTYNDLKTSVANWLQNDELTSFTDDYILLFEAYAARRLRVRGQETTTSLTTSGGSVALPADYLSWRQLVWVNQPDIDLIYRTPSALTTLHPTVLAGVPVDFTIRGGNILIRDTTDTSNAFTFDYFAKPSNLVSSLNFIYTNHFDAYLAGTLAEAFAADRDTDNFTFWMQRRDAAMDEIEKLDIRTRTLGPITIAGPTP